MINTRGNSGFTTQINQVISTTEALFEDQMLGMYLYGSATMNGLRPHSDIDILIITEWEMSDAARETLTKRLLSVSGRAGCAGKRPL